MEKIYYQKVSDEIIFSFESLLSIFSKFSITFFSRLSVMNLHFSSFSLCFSVQSFFISTVACLCNRSMEVIIFSSLSTDFTVSTSSWDEFLERSCKFLVIFCIIGCNCRNLSVTVVENVSVLPAIITQMLTLLVAIQTITESVRLVTYCLSVQHSCHANDAWIML